MNVNEWLLDSNPSIRWQVMRDLMDESEDVVARERSRVASDGWGARLLDLQGPNGQWGGGAYICPGWISTTDTLLLLRDLGLDSTSERARKAIGLVCDHSTWGPEFEEAPFFEGEVEPCINGRVLASGAYFGEASDRLVDRLLREQLEDGGWNCEAPPSKQSSFHTTICVLEGLLEYEKAKGATTAVKDARLRGQEYLVERRHVPIAVNRRGDQSRLDTVLVSNSLALRRFVGAGLLAESRRRTRPPRRRGHRPGAEEAGRRRAMAAREPPRR